MIPTDFPLDREGVHGFPHWRRVRENGLRLAEVTGAHREVVELFAFLHDSKRINDDFDPKHGERAAIYAGSLSGSMFDLGPHELELLLGACRYHSDGLITGDVTIITCWDADRLDLGRVGVRPDPSLLCTSAARDPLIIKWAYERSLQ
jgi:uncharacterized protein